MPDDVFIRNRQQQIALQNLQRRLQQEQLAFDPGNPEYDEYQTRLDAVQAKSEAVAQARLLARSLPPVRP